LEIEFMNGISELIETLGSVGGYVAAVAVVATVVTLAAMLWSWRKINLDEDEAI
jgi:type IV secretory pathway TrbL component